CAAPRAHLEAPHQPGQPPVCGPGIPLRAARPRARVAGAARKRIGSLRLHLGADDARYQLAAAPVFERQREIGLAASHQKTD
nr:hypothetical protein [Tanacetum cinerariifolium]